MCRPVVRACGSRPTAVGHRHTRLLCLVVWRTAAWRHASALQMVPPPLSLCPPRRPCPHSPQGQEQADGVAVQLGVRPGGCPQLSCGELRKCSAWLLGRGAAHAAVARSRVQPPATFDTPPKECERWCDSFGCKPVHFILVCVLAMQPTWLGPSLLVVVARGMHAPAS